jgi:AcrR family transcriptional regulator
MICREGLDETTLVRVAEKAGFAPTTVYAYFVRKDDLITAIVADDVAVFARSIAQDFPFSPEPEFDAEEFPQDDEPFEEFASDGEPDGETEADFEDAEILRFLGADTAAEDSALNDSDATALEIDAAVADETHSALAEATYVAPSEPRDPIAGAMESEALAAFEQRIAQLEARRADPWLERRLREFERMLEAVQERVAAVDGGNTSVVAPLALKLDELGARLDGFEQKYSGSISDAAKSTTQALEAGEARQREALAELRTTTLDLAGRLEALERDGELRKVAAEIRASAPAPAAPESEPAESPQQSAKDLRETGDQDDSYLAAARRAALAAQSLSQA